MANSFFNMGALFKKPITCISCGEKEAYRLDKPYVIIVEVITVVSFVLALFMSGNGDLHTYTSRFASIEEKVAGYALFLLIGVFVVLGYYEFFVKKYNYRCASCDHTFAVKSSTPLYLKLFLLLLPTILVATPFLLFLAKRYIEMNSN